MCITICRSRYDLNHNVRVLMGCLNVFLPAVKHAYSSFKNHLVSYIVLLLLYQDTNDADLYYNTVSCKESIVIQRYTPTPKPL
ncbi:UNVERIFIED_CONTAM: hypothetical protein FKN15_014461 [Acipenser sinensis]